MICAEIALRKTIGLLFAATALCRAAAVGYVCIETDTVPTQVFVDATTIEVGSGPVWVEAAPGKHFVSLFPPKKVYQAASGEAPEHFWERLRKLGAIPEQPGLLSSYEAGAVRAGTNWVYVTPDDTVSVKLSRAEVHRTYRRDSGCVMRTFIGWTLALGAAMVLSVIFGRINS